MDTADNISNPNIITCTKDPRAISDAFIYLHDQGGKNGLPYGEQYHYMRETLERERLHASLQTLIRAKKMMGEYKMPKHGDNLPIDATKRWVDEQIRLTKQKLEEDYGCEFQLQGEGEGDTEAA